MASLNTGYLLCFCPNPSVDTYLWVEKLEKGAVNRAQRESRYPGGKGLHVALAIAELGEPVALLGVWGGATGQWLQAECTRLGVACFGPQLADWNRTCLTIVGPEAETRDTEILGMGPRISQSDYQRLLADFRELLPQSAGIVMSGSWPPGAPPDPYGPFLELARQHGKKAFLDCSGDALVKALAHHPFAVHVNKSEAEAISPDGGQGSATAHLMEHTELLALTAGKDGLFLYGTEEAVHAGCRLEQVFSAVGSGDCLVAGLAVAYRRGLGLADSARLGAACGAANCIREDLGMLYRKDVERLLPKVKIEFIEKVG